MGTGELRQRGQRTDSGRQSGAREAAGVDARSGHRTWWRNVARIAATLVCLSVCLSYLITETALWGHQSKWTNWRNYVPRRQRVFTPVELRQYDGTSPGLPILLAIEGDVYDVTLGSGFYGPGSPYSLFAGRDATRAFGTNCLSRKDHLTHDTRGLTQGELAGIKGWHALFDNHQRYVKVGVVRLDPIDPGAPIPPPCDGAQPKPH
ncbi:hypothetical protein LPJ61_002254 [Coemansia biformis]|uniref:Cytochrome b5 heme-binding domain-containing protein n=1 Tax=Coemansia biformis TaxID=1286918 RepID=A0A9W8CZC2_9FUNG|nr:hypothetical protein LPJ61_002254 [Coemansia biformis]